MYNIRVPYFRKLQNKGLGQEYQKHDIRKIIVITVLLQYPVALRRNRRRNGRAYSAARCGTGGTNSNRQRGKARQGVGFRGPGGMSHKA